MTDDHEIESASGRTASTMTPTQLSHLFRVDHRTLTRLLDACPYKRSGNSKLYDVREAAGYLVEPRIDIGDYIRSQRTQDLPTHLSEAYWSAMRKRQIYEEHAGDLWRSQDVLDVLGATFVAMRTTLQLWVESLAEETKITDEQRLVVQRLVDGLQGELHQALVKMPAERETRASIKEIEGIERAAPADDLDLV
jgi:hypothetical protein